MNTMYLVGPILNICFGVVVIYLTYQAIKTTSNILDKIKGDDDYDIKKK